MGWFITAREWGANPSKDATEDSHPIGSTLGVTLHYEGPKMGDFPHSSCARKVRSIERFHEYGRGWGDVAYNLLVCPHGYVFEGRGAGVRSAANGYTSANESWYAVCYLGGVGDGLTEAGKRGFVRAVQYLREHGGAGPRVNGHRDHKATQCPGDVIYRWLQTADFGGNVDEKEDDMPEPRDLWNHRINEYDASTKADDRPARVVLAQAHNRAGDARRAARRAEQGVQRIEKALEVLGDSLGAEVGKAVREALKEATVEVDVNVAGGDEK